MSEGVYLQCAGPLYTSLVLSVGPLHALCVCRFKNKPCSAQAACEPLRVDKYNYLVHLPQKILYHSKSCALVSEVNETRLPLHLQWFLKHPHLPGRPTLKLLHLPSIIIHPFTRPLKHPFILSSSPLFFSLDWPPMDCRPLLDIYCTCPSITKERTARRTFFSTSESSSLCELYIITIIRGQNKKNTSSEYVKVQKLTFPSL